MGVRLVALHEVVFEEQSPVEVKAAFVGGEGLGSGVGRWRLLFRTLWEEGDQLVYWLILGTDLAAGRLDGIGMSRRTEASALRRG